MDLSALADFNLVATHGGLGRASRATGRPKATLSRRVLELEQSLAVRLIDRGSRSLRLTDEGRALHERTAGLLAELAEVGEVIASGGSTPRGSLRISAPVVFAQVVLGRIGASFALAYPQVQLEIVAEDRFVDPVEDGYHLVIRINPSQDDRLIGRLIMEDERLIVSAPSLKGPTASGKQRAEIHIPAIVMSATPAGSIWRMQQGQAKVTLLRPEPILRLSSLTMVRDAVLTGAGFGLLPRLLVEEDIRAGRLVQWGTEDGPPVEAWALQSPHRLTSAKVRVFLDALLQAFPRKRFAPEVRR